MVVNSSHIKAAANIRAFGPALTPCPKRILAKPPPNPRNYLTEVAQGPLGSETSKGTYDYNAAGLRIHHWGSERGDIEYVYDGDAILDEWQGSTLVAHYTYGNQRLSLETPSGTQFYQLASLGTAANLTDESGAVIKSYRVDPFGTITQEAGVSVNRQVFTGQEHDEQTGLIYFGARYYDPETARFISQDSYSDYNGLRGEPTH